MFLSIPPSLAAPFRTPVHVLLCCTSLCTRHTATFQSYHGCFLLVLHSGHKILFLSSSDIPSTVSFLPYQLHLTLTTPFSLAVFSLHLHASRQVLYHIFLKYSPEINPCFQFSCALVPLLLHPPYSTNVMTSHLVIHSLCSNAMLLGDIPCMPLYSCTFFHKEYAGFSSCCAFCRLATCTAFLSLFLFFLTLIFGHFHLKCPTSQYLKYLTSSTILFLLILTSSLTPYLITLLDNTSNLFLEIGSPFSL